ncbi:acid phosphatase 1-like [Olea europaea var. sylvestris]|uniref:acid phosphatase 1-like n=1 Tax=Olea europaea var. sylvestris TaxID=158386 RepID=UPI000C1D405A|nr:acid phosphatase 1-like [Olea europaea var. sylvestris]
MRLAVLFFPATIVTTCNADCHILQEGQIYILRPRSGAAGHRLEGLDCLSWCLVVETNNLQNWDTVFMSCEDIVGHYMLGKQYRHECELVSDAAIKYAKSLKLAGDGKDIWIFDVDETVLINIPYYARSDVLVRALPYNKTSFNERIAKGKLQVVPGALRLYKSLLRLEFKIVFLTGVEEE